MQEVARVKLKQKDFDLDNPILKYELNHINSKFKTLNDCLGFGKAGGFARLRPHMIRKFHASYLNQGGLEEGLLNRDDIDSLHGREKDKTRESYFKANPEYLKLKYIEVMSNISLYHKYDYAIDEGKIVVFPRPLKYF